MKAIAILLALTPSFIHVFIRRLSGASIGRGSRIKFGTILLSKSKNLKIGRNVKIGPFTYVSANIVIVGDYSKIKALSAVSARIIELGSYVHISPLAIISGDHSENSLFIVGDHSRFFPYCWIETGEGVEIGNNVGIGGHTLIFTHGVWPDYIDGGPVTYGPVIIEDNVWLPWRVFIMPNVTIGKNAIIGANSTVTKSIPENVVAAGSPAKVVKEGVLEELSKDEKIERVLHIFSEFSKDLNFRTGTKTKVEGNKLALSECSILIDDIENATEGDLIVFISISIESEEIERLKAKGISTIHHADKNAIIAGKSKSHKSFIDFLRKYGVRLSINES